MKNNFYSDDYLLDNYLEEIKKIPRLTHDEVIELAKKIEKGDKVAREKLISSNFRLVVYFAKRYKKYLLGPGLSFFELILEGNSGLINAVEKFDWRRGRKFSTFAKEEILNPIRKALYSKSRTIRIPTEQLREFHNLQKSFERLNCKLENSFDHNRRKKIAAEMDLLDEKLGEFHKKLPLNILYLQHPVGDDDSLLENFIEDSDSVPAEVQADENKLAEKIRLILADLAPREEKVLRLRFGIGEESDHTLEEIGEIFGLSRERIRQVEARVLRKLSNNPKARALWR